MLLYAIMLLIRITERILTQNIRILCISDGRRMAARQNDSDNAVARISVLGSQYARADG